MAKWEYCVVSTQAGDEWLEYWENGGADRKSLKKESELATYQYVRSVVAQLGDKGWELVGAAGPLLYFKRTRPA